MNLRLPNDQPQSDSYDWVSRMRAHRDMLLKGSDWAMAPDAPTDKDAWAAYRQALRDFPSTWEPSEEANFPNPPA